MRASSGTLPARRDRALVASVRKLSVHGERSLLTALAIGSSSASGRSRANPDHPRSANRGISNWLFAQEHCSMPSLDGHDSPSID